MTRGSSRVISIAWAGLVFLYPEAVAADNDCREQARPRLITPDNPYFGYRPRESDRIYPSQTRQDKNNADMRRDARDRDLWRQPTQIDCPPPAWVREEDPGYRPRDNQSRDTRRNDVSVQRTPQVYQTFPEYPPAGYFGPYWGAGNYPMYGGHFYRPDYLYSPNQDPHPSSQESGTRR